MSKLVKILIVLLFPIMITSCSSNSIDRDFNPKENKMTIIKQTDIINKEKNIKKNEDIVLEKEIFDNLKVRYFLNIALLIDQRIVGSIQTDIIEIKGNKENIIISDTMDTHNIANIESKIINSEDDNHYLYLYVYYDSSDDKERHFRYSSISEITFNEKLNTFEIEELLSE